MRGERSGKAVRGCSIVDMSGDPMCGMETVPVRGVRTGSCGPGMITPPRVGLLRLSV